MLSQLAVQSKLENITFVFVQSPVTFKMGPGHQNLCERSVSCSYHKTA